MGRLRESRILAWATLRPLPAGWRIATLAVLGMAAGLAIVVARVANATSYLSDAPEVCLNCHVMTNAYATWQRGSHARVAKCVDCHLPQSNIIAQLAFKAADGMKDSYVFLTHQEPQVPRLSAVRVVQANCLRCHHRQFEMVRLAGVSERKCWDCHNNIHGSIGSLSSSPHVRRPQLPPAGLDWMKGSGK